jgi:hypothetical protein
MYGYLARMPPARHALGPLVRAFTLTPPENQLHTPKTYVLQNALVDASPLLHCVVVVVVY